MSVWSPSNVKFTVLRARNLIAKGKGGTNDVFVTIQLGKEKYQTSTIKNARHPEWFEECDLPIPHLHSEIEVSVYHRGVLSDDFLGYATLPLWLQKIQEQPNTQWVRLSNKPGKETTQGSSSKSRGEMEVRVTFHSHSRSDHYGPASSTSGLHKKRSSSLRNLAGVVGDKLKFARSKSFKENRRDPEGSKTLNRNHNHNVSLQNIPEEHLSRSYSLSSSAQTPSTMAVDRGGILTYPGPRAGGTGDLRTQSMLDITTTNHHHHHLAIPEEDDDLLSSQAPPPYQLRSAASQDSVNPTLLHPHHPQQSHRSSAFFNSVPQPPHLLDSVLRRRELARYDSIRERTEPESTSTDDDEYLDKPRRRRPPKPLPIRVLRSSQQQQRPRSGEVSLDSKDQDSFGSKDPNSSDLGSHSLRSGAHHQSRRDTSLLQSGQSREETAASMDSGDRCSELQRSEMMTNGSLGRGTSLSGADGQRARWASSGELHQQGDREVRLRKRTKRERLRTYRQGSRRFTVQGSEVRGCGLYDDSFSEACSDSPKTEVSMMMIQDHLTVYSKLSKEELLRLLIQSKAQLIRKDQYIRDLESYVDNLLVRVMETTPRILHRPPLSHRPP